ncbi:hypothetical protein dsx2_3415 [Desulfovibrio sp. X2]|uniref:hypothetical protein n=1 Tax=Desulfovibrio sp. X2 TaxID=941449 RepID=UPI000358EECF|nr:hypothetical protein [Desulfovibrio sp. X2]EPR39362.1 hypothetical protein dsx2_3415 [Desulfovibrio sp. X2]
MSTIHGFQSPAGASSLGPTIASLLEVGDSDVHEIDFSDVMVAQDVIGFLGNMTKELLHRYLPNPQLIDSSFSDLIGTIDRKAFWIGKTESLILTLDIIGNRHFFQIPRELWETKARRWN